MDVIVDCVSWISSLGSRLFAWRGFNRIFFPAPGRNMEIRYPVTCTIELEPILDIRHLQPGDTVTVDGGDNDLCRRVAVYVGNNEVVEFTNELRKTTLAAFRGEGLPVAKVRYTTPGMPNEPYVIARKAMEALQNPNLVGKYDIISNNGEHFVTHCTFNKRLSYEGIKAAKVNDETKPETWCHIS